MSYHQLSKVLALSGIFLLLFVAANWLQAQEAPPRSLEFAIQVAESDPSAYYLPTDPLSATLPESAPEVMAPADVPTSWTNLIYETYRDTNWNIYSIKPDGTSLTQLVNNLAVDSTPVFNWGTTAYLFVSDRDDNAEIYKAATDGSYTIRLTNNPASDLLPTWSPDNSQIAFQSNRTGNSDIFVMDATGNNIRQLTFSASYDGAPSWSPDGRQLVFSSWRTGTYELWIMNADGSNQHRIPNTAPALYPSWSPLGDKIAFTRDQDNDGWFEVWLINTDGTGARILENDGYNMDLWLPTWSPDGDYIALNQTNWVLYYGQYYWTTSYVRIKLVETGYSYQLPGDDRAWKSYWASADTTSPGLCTINAASQQRWSQISFGVTAQDGQSGIRSYDVQARKAGGSWTELMVNFTTGGATYEGEPVDAVDFRCRATDRAGNVRSWNDAPIVSTIVDAIVPTSAVQPLPAVVQGTQTTVRWDGQDVGEGIANYDIYVKDGPGNWTLWQDDATNKTAVFNGTIGHTYQFRSQATDGIGHTESWRPAADTAVTFYTTHITHTLTDNRGLPVADALVTLSPTAVYSSTSPGLFDGYLTGSGSYTANWVAPGYGALPPTDQATAASFLAVFPPADNALANGGFEQPDLAPWIPNDPGIMPETEPHTGQQAVVLPGVGSVMSISQSLTLPANLHQPTLSFLYKLSAGTVSAQVQTETLFSSSTAALDWQHVWADLTPYAGQTITLTFSYTGTSEAAFLDDVTIGSWHTPQITAVTPSPAEAGDTLTITGANFIAPLEVSLGDIPLNNVTWISSTELTAQVPDEMLWGDYPLAVKNAGGATAVAADAVLVDNNNLFLPIIFNNGNSTYDLTKAAWPTSGQNAAHTGYQSGDPGASHYTLAWETTLPYSGDSVELKQIAVADGVLVASSNHYSPVASDNLVVGLNAYTGQELWRHVLPSSLVNPPTIARGSVFVPWNSYIPGSQNSRLISLNLYDGTKNWEKSFPYTDQYSPFGPVVTDDIVYTPTYNHGHYVKAFGLPSSGEILWEAHTGTGVSSHYDNWAPAVAGSQLYSFIKETLTIHDRLTGAYEWHIYTEVGSISYSMNTVPVIAGRRAFVVGSQKVAAINLDTRQVQWSKSGLYGATMPAVVGDYLYVLNGGELESRDVTDGSLRWWFSADSELINAPVVTDRYVYVASAEHTYVLDRFTAQVVWEVDKGGWLSIADGYLYIAQPDKTIAAYRAQEP